MTLAAEMTTLRNRVGWIESRHVRSFRLSGSQAYEALDRVLPIPLYLQDTEMRATLLLDEDGCPWADVLVARDGDDFVLLCEAVEPESIAPRLASLVAVDEGAHLEQLSQSHTCLSLHGPWAWELAAELLGPQVMGQPYLTLQPLREALCLRSGKTGEYGYDLLIPRDASDAWLARLQQLGQPFNLSPISLTALDLAALENWFFWIRATGLGGLTPLELQLQWRISRHKPYVGSEALARRRERGISARVTTVAASETLESGASVYHQDTPIGRILHAADSPLLKQSVAWALLDEAHAVAGVDCYQAVCGSRPVALKTVSPPLVSNVSLTVDPHRHSYKHGRLPE